MKRWHLRGLALVAGGIIAAVVAVQAAPVLYDTFTTSQHRVIRATDKPAGCANDVTNDYQFGAEGSVSDIVGAVQCLMGMKFDAAVIDEPRTCTAAGSSFMIDPSKGQIAYCDEGLFMTKLFAESMSSKPAVARWFHISVGAVNAQFRTIPAILCASGYVARQMPGFAQQHKVFVEVLFAEVASLEAWSFVSIGIHLNEQHQSITACKGAEGTTTISWTPEAPPPAPAVLL